MKQLTALGLSALMASTLVLPNLSVPADARNGRNAAIAAGAVLGVAAAVALSSRARADDGYYDRRDYGYRGDRGGYGNDCRRLSYKCDRGSDWACEKFDRNC